MNYIAEKAHNWANAKERAEAARQHTLKMEAEFQSEIQYSEARSHIYDGVVAISTWPLRRQNIIIEDTDSVSAIFHYANGKTAVLNFASFKNPGGKFMEGSQAQEECLCHESTLYNVLSRWDKGFYERNRVSVNRNLYQDRVLYNPEIIFLHKDDMRPGIRKRACDVITCAAPNKRAAQKYQKVTEEENTVALRQRIRCVLSVAQVNRVDTLILGAFGCGVFGQDPVEVAQIFKEELLGYDFRQVVFPVPFSTNGNLDAFRHVFDD